MYVDSSEDPAGVKGATGAAGDGVFVDPEKLERQAEELAKLGDHLRERLHGVELQPLRLGSSPPALWFAQKVGRLTGPEGTPGVLRSWADGIAGLGDTERVSAADYRAEDESHETRFRRMESS
jgi:hypothetical protein